MMKDRNVFAALLLASGVSLMNVGAAYAAETGIDDSLAFARCEDYINIRSDAGTDGEIVAKIYNNGSAEILEEADGWYKIRSGNATGYVKAEYFVTGEEAAKVAKMVAYNVAVVYPNDLFIRPTPDTEHDSIGVAHQNDELEVVDYKDGWMKVALTRDSFGYVDACYVEPKTYYPTAVTLEEEAAAAGASVHPDEMDAPVAEYDEWNELYSGEDYTDDVYYGEDDEYTEDSGYDDSTADAGDSYTEDTEYDEWDDGSSAGDDSYSEDSYYEELSYDDYSEDSYSENNYSEESYEEDSYTDESYDQYYEDDYADDSYTEDTYSDDTSYSEDTYTEEDTYTDDYSSNSSLGQQIADYAVQFVGNPYVWGGTSLTNGADCSGFTMSVFANFGIGLAHSAAGQVGGTSVSMDNLQAGDLVFYSDGSGISHVAIYIGGGQIVHAANSNSGIIISGYNYNTPVSACRYW